MISINPDNNSITVGTKKNLIIKKIELRTLNILGDELDFKNEIDMKIRSTGRLLKGKVNFLGKKRVLIYYFGKNYKKFFLKIIIYKIHLYTLETFMVHQMIEINSYLIFLNMKIKM